MATLYKQINEHRTVERSHYLQLQYNCMIFLHIAAFVFVVIIILGFVRYKKRTVTAPIPPTGFMGDFLFAWYVSGEMI